MNENKTKKEKGKNFLKDWRFWLAAVAIYFLAQVMGGNLGRQTAQQENRQQAEKKTVGDYRKLLVNECTARGESERYCKCLADKLSSYTVKELRQMTNQASEDGTISPIMQEADNACR